MPATRVRVRKKKFNGTWILTPVGWDPLDYPGVIARLPEAARWLLAVIRYRQSVLSVDPSEFVPLHSDALADVMGGGTIVKDIREEMVRPGLIEVDRRYWTGSKCMGFRIGPALAGADWTKHDCMGAVEVNRFERFKDEVTKPKGLDCEAHWHLWSWVPRIEIDRERAERIVAGFTGDKWVATQLQLGGITLGLWRANVDAFGRRFHTNYSNLDKQLRACLHYQGQPLVEVDVVNCQPYLFALVLLEIWLTARNWDTGAGGRGDGQPPPPPHPIFQE